MHRRFALVALAFLFVAPSHAREWLITYAATEEQIIQSPEGDTPPPTESRSYTETIALADDYVVVQNDRQKTVHDFTRRRCVILNLATNTYDDWSLFGFVDFFETELFNRNAIGAGMRAAKIERMETQFTRFDNETSLRLESRPNTCNSDKPVIEQVKLGHTIEFRHSGQTAVRVIPSDIAPPAELRHRFVNYLAYSCEIHPEIRRALADSSAIPRELTFVWRLADNLTTTTLRLISAEPSEVDSSVIPSTATLAVHDNDSIFQLLAMIREAERTGHRPTRGEAISFAEKAIANGRTLDGLMALLEHGLQSGEQLTEKMRQHRKKFDRDPACQIYLKAFAQSNREDCERGLAANATIDRAGLQRAYMLELQRANHLDRLGRYAEATECYLTVIRANPFHAGALHDLGMLLTRTWDHPKGWLCWDTARRLYPNHPMLKHIAVRERTLLSLYPDFF